jgi:hypothetical protein
MTLNALISVERFSIRCVMSRLRASASLTARLAKCAVIAERSVCGTHLGATGAPVAPGAGFREALLSV